MINSNKIDWNTDIKNDGYLYFAQRSHEMLDYMTRAIYRIPLVNTTVLIDEYLQISHGYNNKSNLNCVNAEFIESFSNDVIIKHCQGFEKIHTIISKLNIADITERELIYRYLKNSISVHYLDWCKEYLRHYVPQKNQKNKIEDGILCFLPELVRLGYTRDEIFHNINEIILQEGIIPSDAFEKFLNIYSKKDCEFEVYMAVDKRLCPYIESLHTILNSTFFDDENFEGIKVESNFRIIKFEKIRGLDKSNAVRNAWKRVELFLSFYQFLGDYGSTMIWKNAYVVDLNGDKRKIPVVRDKFRCLESDDRLKIGTESTALIAKVINNVFCNINEISNILILHNRAISNNGLENGFLNLWSILEIMCVKKTNEQMENVDQVNDDNDKKTQLSIGQSVYKHLLPILQMDYLKEVFEDLAENLKAILTRERYSQLINSITECDLDAAKIACFLLLKKYYSQADKFVEELENYPVIRTRILDFLDHYKTTNTLWEASNRYYKKVQSDLYRIYRTRNGITHAGNKPKRIKDIGELLHVYVDHLLKEKIYLLAKDHLGSFEEVEIEENLLREQLEKRLSKTAEWDVDVIKLIFNEYNFWGTSNFIMEDEQ